MSDPRVGEDCSFHVAGEEAVLFPVNGGQQEAGAFGFAFILGFDLVTGGIKAGNPSFNSYEPVSVMLVLASGERRRLGQDEYDK
ncbi:MAG TPA: hypothetical protein VKM94_20860 [Blastocatellia bacterium]|nr:hypothetical protein [Blastocatellia bacterium]